MGNSSGRGGLVEIYSSSYDEHTINRGTSDQPKPLLKFHSVHGENIQLVKDGRIARRKDSFCKGLAFSNRPISIDEIVCLRLCEIGTNWSGVLRFGVTNVDPASFRDIELPKFVCPDLTSKAGYWAKALAERYSMAKGILHFYINSKGELHYGINGVNKGLFFNGINVLLPLWIVVDIYGNSIGVEFVDPADVDLRSISGFHTNSSCADADGVSDGGNVVEPRNSTPANNLLSESSGIGQQRSSSARASPFSQFSSQMRFHTVKGANITLDSDGLVATRKLGEYYLGYVFTERPIRVDDRLNIMVLQTEPSFSGSMAFGLTSCDPVTVPASRLPIDSDELLERPEYWVCIKDVAAHPNVGDRLSIRVDGSGQVFFAKNDATPRVIMHVDISVPLWAFFDLYGTTGKIKILETLGCNTSLSENLRNHRASSEGSSAYRRESSHDRLRTVGNRPASTALNLDQLRVALPSPSLSNENLPSTSTHSASIPIPSAIASTTVGNVSSSSSSNSASSSADPIDVARLRTGISKRLNLATSDLSRNNSAASHGSSPTANNEFESRYSTLLPRRRGEMLYNPSSHSPRPRPIKYCCIDKLPSTQQYNTHHHYSSSPTFLNALSDNFGSLTSSIAPLSTPSIFSSFTSQAPSRNTDATKSKPNFSVPATSVENNDDSNGSCGVGSECSICMNNKVNAVIYRCGHMCMCFECAKVLHRRSGECPICRTTIIDVIRCYPS